MNIITNQQQPLQEQLQQSLQPNMIQNMANEQELIDKSSKIFFLFFRKKKTFKT